MTKLLSLYKLRLIVPFDHYSKVWKTDNYSSLVSKRGNVKSLFRILKIEGSQNTTTFNESHNGTNQRNFATDVNINDLPPPAKFIKLSEGTMGDFKAAQEHFSRVASTENTVDRWINMIEVLYFGRFMYFLAN